MLQQEEEFGNPTCCRGSISLRLDSISIHFSRAPKSSLLRIRISSSMRFPPSQLKSMALYKSVLVILLLSQSILPGMMIPISIFWGSYVSRAFPRAPSLVDMQRSRSLFLASVTRLLGTSTSPYL